MWGEEDDCLSVQILLFKVHCYYWSVLQFYLLWRHEFSKCAVALQFVYMRVYFVFVLSWICPAGREEELPAMPYTYFWSTSHGGVRITTFCARCALCTARRSRQCHMQIKKKRAVRQWGLGQKTFIQWFCKIFLFAPLPSPACDFGSFSIFLWVSIFGAKRVNFSTQDNLVDGFEPLSAWPVVCWGQFAEEWIWAGTTLLLP